MAGTLTVSTCNKLLDSLGLKTIKLHSQDPTYTGTVGVIVGAQKDFLAPNAVNGAIQTAGSIEIDVVVAGGSVSVTHYSLWDDATVPACIATGQLADAQSYSATGKYIVNTLTVDINK